MNEHQEKKIRIVLFSCLTFVIMSIGLLMTNTTVKAEELNGLSLGADNQWHYYVNGEVDSNYIGLQ